MSRQKVTHLADNKYKDMMSSQTFVNLNESLWNHSFEPTIAWPFDCKSGTTEEGAELEKQKRSFGVHKCNCGNKFLF